MSKIAAVVRHEVRQMLPPTLFFVVWLNLLVVTVAVLSDDHELSAVSHVSAIVAALLIGKAFLLAEKLPITRVRPGRPLIHTALWSALVYLLIALALHLVERLISAATDSRGFLYRAKADVLEFDWPMFVVVSVWLTLLLVVYAVGHALITAIGPKRIREALRGPAPAQK